ncbi:MAG: hypothetical protein ACJAT7_003273, partial [Psychromonas sp.]|uniref:hypothetical protein n=1 Tax=Psychromonas sp. TaxID=1884585 RepID=UPI0039E4C81B
VKPSAHKRKITNNRCGYQDHSAEQSGLKPAPRFTIYTPSRAEDQQRKLNQALTSESIKTLCTVLT